MIEPGAFILVLFFGNNVIFLHFPLLPYQEKFEILLPYKSISIENL